MHTFRHYTEMLIKRFVQPHLNAGANEIHVLFDDPDYSEISPKMIERQKRDKSAHLDTSHKCIQIDQNSSVPTDWRGKLLNCRVCKKALCAFLSHDMLTVVPSSLRENQIFFTAGGFADSHRHKCLCIRKGGTPLELQFLTSNAEETDLRIWLHCVHSSGTRKMLYSPDTDVYNIGLPIMQEHPSLEVYIELKGRKNDSSIPSFKQIH